MNLTDIFYEKAEKQPDHPAIVDTASGKTWSYRKLRHVIEQTADTMRSAGIRPGQTIGLHISSGCDYIVLTYALWRCGACVVPIAFELTPDEKKRICREIRIEAVISPDKRLSVLGSLLKGKTVSLFNAIVLSPIKHFRRHPAGFADINAAFLRFTSGTTGNCKGVILSHETIRDRIHAANEILKICSKDRIVWLLSMSYHFAVSIVSYLSFGATILLCKNYFGAGILETAAKFDGTVIYGSPVHYELMAHAADKTYSSLPNLRLAVSTTTALRKEVADAFYHRFGQPLVQAYGIIEIGLPCINVNRPGEKKTGVGPVLPAYKILLVDVGEGEEKKAIKFRGKGLIDAYYEPFQTRSEIMPDGWFNTGDLGMLDKDKCLHILGRAKEMISIGGMKFFPQEVEDVLESHPTIAEACVFSRKEKRMGESAHARVKLTQDVVAPPSDKELKNFCAKRLAAYKIPETIEVVEALARTASGKKIRREVTTTK